MKVRIKTNLGSAEFPEMPWQADEERDVADDVGARLIARGVAEDAAPPVPAPKPEQEPPKQAKHFNKLLGVQDKPSIADTVTPAISGEQPKPKE